MTRRRAYTVVDQFEDALCEYTGAPYAVATSSCTDALFLSMLWCMRNTDQASYAPNVWLPKHNYVGVYQAAVRAGYTVTWTDEQWHYDYHVKPLPVVDSAKHLARGMYAKGTMMCLSFGASKRLNIGRGGAILTDNQDAADWIRPRSMDGRTPGEDYQTPRFAVPGHRMNLTPEEAARGLLLLTYLDDPPSDTWKAYPDLSKAEWTT